MADPTYVCGRCLHEAAGYSKSELEQQGWVWHPFASGAPVVRKNAGLSSGQTVSQPTDSFIVCDECELLAKRRRRRVYVAPLPTHCPDKSCGSALMIVGPVSAVVGTPFNKALQTALCPVCDRYPELLYPRSEYEPGLLYPPA